MRIHIDLENLHIVKIPGFFSIAGNEMGLSSQLADFRRVGGMEFQFKLTRYAGGQKVGRPSKRNTK